MWPGAKYFGVKMFFFRFLRGGVEMCGAVGGSFWRLREFCVPIFTLGKRIRGIDLYFF